MRFLGSARFEIGVVQRVFGHARYPCSIAFKYVTRSKPQLNDFYKKNYNKKEDVSVQLTEDDFKLKYLDTMDLNPESRFGSPSPSVFGESNTSLPPSSSNSSPTPTDPEHWEWFDQQTCDNLAIFYSGKMPYISKDTNFFPAALRNDGTIDIVLTDSRTNLRATCDALFSLDKGLHVWKDEVYHFKVEAFKVIPMLPEGKKSFISVDGESFPFQAFQVELLSGIMKTVMSDGEFKETGFLEKI
ncbi:unnamed protein product [Ambrosiozyma monospora]|uniref:Unnamed protein product n=1 Tax=Ambrosiozyma monospora TaxID=43982 RepID=A0ACB5SS08_AMBMO|nr:unnamed protein product [Ambrosiozyma monospora]